MTPDPDQSADFSKIYGDTLKQALENLDRLTEEAKSAHAAAVEAQHAAQQTRAEIERKSDEIARDVLERRRKKMEQELQKKIETALISKLLYAGRLSEEISAWLEVPIELVESVRSRFVHTSAGDVEGIVNIKQDGRGGTIHFLQGDHKVSMYWEFGGGRALALIFIPKEETWEKESGFPVSERMRILDWIARQVVYQKASGCNYIIQDDVIEILEPGEE